MTSCQRGVEWQRNKNHRCLYRGSTGALVGSMCLDNLGHEQQFQCPHRNLGAPSPGTPNTSQRRTPETPRKHPLARPLHAFEKCSLLEQLTITNVILFVEDLKYSTNRRKVYHTSSDPQNVFADLRTHRCREPIKTFDRFHFDPTITLLLPANDNSTP